MSGFTSLRLNWRRASLNRAITARIVTDLKASHLALTPKNPTSTSDRIAERRAAQEQVFLREVDEAMREDDAARLLRKYGLPIGLAIVAALAGLGGWLAWNSHVTSEQGRKGEAFAIALDQVEAGRWDPAKASLDTIAAQGGAGYTASARLVEGGMALDRKKPDDAAKIFAEVAADPRTPQPYRDLATIRAMAVKFDTTPPQQVIDRLKPLAVPGGPWFGSAGELVGVAELKLGRRAEAGALFAAMAKDTGVPASMRRRAGQLAAELGVASPQPTADAAPALAQ
jgi:hypothetical protein